MDTPQKRYAQRNPEKVKKWQREWRESHKEERAIYLKKYKKVNREKLKEKEHEYHKKYIARKKLDPIWVEKRREYRRKYRKENTEIVRMWRKSNKKRGISCKLRFEIFKRDNFTCFYCGRKAPAVVLQVDHKIPKSKGGKTAKENLITSCFECNIGKSDNLLN